MRISSGKLSTVHAAGLRGCQSNSKAMRYRFLILVVLLTLLPLPFAIAQVITANIVGNVLDPSGAVIPGATIMASNVNTGYSQSAVSDGSGGYRIGSLPIGQYVVEISARGFKGLKQRNIVLSVDQTFSLSVTLTVGVQTELVTVTDAPPAVNLSTSQVGQTILPEQITQLPLVNRSVYSQVSLIPGVQSNSASSLNSNTPNFVIGVPSTDIEVNGSIDSGLPSVSYYLDGGLNMTGLRNYGNQLPNPDAIEEFRVETNNYSTEYGRMSGAVVTAVTHSGTNQFKGSLFEFVRNTAFNATPWNASRKAPYHRNQFGGTIGGPIVHNKTFFFGSFAELRQTSGTFLNGAIVPTALERTGNFSQSKVLPINPVTHTVYAYNGVPGLIPPSSLDPTAKNILGQYIPLSNGPNNTWTGYYTGPLDNYEILGKINHSFSSSDQLQASYFMIETSQTVPASTQLLWMDTLSATRQQNVNLSEVHIFNPTTTNNAWLTYTRTIGGRTNLPQISLGDLGSTFYTQGPKSLPAINVSGYFNLARNLAGPLTGDNFYSVRDAVNMERGKHSIVFGAEMSLEKGMIDGNLDNFGNFTIATSAPNSTGNALADFVTGTVASMTQAAPYSSFIDSWYYGFFANDNWRLAQHLNLNLGLRYDLQTPPVEALNRTDTFVPGRQSTIIPGAPLGLLFPGDKGVPRGITDFRLQHLSPRIGLVWDPFGDGKTAVRAGGGIFFGSVDGNEWNQPANGQPFAVSQTFNSIASLTNVYGNPASFPNGNPFPYTYSPQNPRFLPNASVIAISQKYQWPVTYQFNLAVQRQLPGGISLTTGYVGTVSRDIPLDYDVNYPAYAPGASTSQTSINNRRPYDPGVLGQTQLIASVLTGSYHSLQVSVEKPMSKNFMLGGNYVWSHTIWGGEPGAASQNQPQDSDALSEEKGPGDFDQRSMASISGIWKLEYYRGDSHSLKQLLNGWEISPIVTLHSGLPFNILTGADKNDDSYTSDRPNLVPGQRPFLSTHRTRSAAAAEWFNTAAFVANAPGTGIGPGGADGNVGRNFLTAPGYRDVDLGVYRNMHLPRNILLQLRAEATNAFNLVSLAAPTATVISASDGKITSAVANSNRQIQLGARLTF
jgi:hypothetical protein